MKLKTNRNLKITLLDSFPNINGQNFQIIKIKKVKKIYFGFHLSAQNMLQN